MLAHLLKRALVLCAAVAGVMACTAQAGLIITPGASDTTIAFEAEIGTIYNFYDDPSKGWVVDGVSSPAAGASGGSYVVATENHYTDPDIPHNSIAFSINFAKTGNYTLYYRDAYTTQDFEDPRDDAANNDSFYYEDGALGGAWTFEEENSIPGISASSWDWANGPSDDITVSSAGTQMWVVGNREDGFMLDRFVLVHEDETATVDDAFLDGLANTQLVPEPFIYREDLEVGGLNDRPYSDVGWSNVETDGDTLTNSTDDPSRVVAGTDFNGQNRSYHGYGSSLAQWLSTSELNFNPADYQDDLAISFLHRESDIEAGDGYRVGFQVGGNWYLQDTLIAGNTALTTYSQSLDSLSFVNWSGAPADDSTPWSVPALGGGSPLPAGQITGLGLMLVRNADDDAFRFDDITVSGTLATVIPEPSTFALATLGLLGLALFGRRRRR
jgi:hypothetical protein